MSTPRRINGILTSQFEIPSESNEQPISHPLIQAIAADNLEDAIKNSNRLSEPTKLNAIKLCERRATPVAQKIYSLLTGQKFLKPKPSESIVDELDRKFSAASIKNDITTQAAVCSEPKFDKPKKHATKASSYDVSAKKQERLTF